MIRFLGFGFFLDRFNFHISRSRVAYIFGYGLEPNTDRGWHIDEATCKLLRVNIPLQTSDEYVMQWNNKTYKQEHRYTFLGENGLYDTKSIQTARQKVWTQIARLNYMLEYYLKNYFYGKL